VTDPIPSSPPDSAQPAPLNPTQATLPTIGAIVGSALGKLISAKLGFTDPLIGNTIDVVAAGLVTAVFHWVGTKFGAIKL
jgi:hypothetical protein